MPRQCEVLLSSWALGSHPRGSQETLLTERTLRAGEFKDGFHVREEAGDRHAEKVSGCGLVASTDEADEVRACHLS